jgi:hypothetical protein
LRRRILGRYDNRVTGVWEMFVIAFTVGTAALLIAAIISAMVSW